MCSPRPKKPVCSSFGFTLMFLISCKTRGTDISRTLSDSAPAGAKELAITPFENPSADEPQDIAKILGAMQAGAKQRAQKMSPAMRFTHAKTLGCVAAQFTVPDFDDADADLRVGVFHDARTYNAWIRYSSFAFAPQPDTMPDNRGMAIKVLGVDGTKLQPGGENDGNLDLVLTNDISFFFPNPKKFLSFLTVSATAGAQEWFKQNTREDTIHTRNVKAGVYGSLFEGTFGSMTPYLYGPDRAVKFVAKPCTAKPTAPGTSADFLSQRLREDLDAGQEACYDLYVQFFVDQSQTPIEDASVDWHEDTTRARKVARITVPPQSRDLINSKQDFCENLSFSPWRTLAEHRPIGGINRLRRQIYGKLADQRHALNHIPNVEPTSKDFPQLNGSSR